MGRNTSSPPPLYEKSSGSVLIPQISTHVLSNLKTFCQYYRLLNTVRAIPFEKLVGGCLVSAFQTTPQRFFTIFWGTPQ